MNLHSFVVSNWYKWLEVLNTPIKAQGLLTITCHFQDLIKNSTLINIKKQNIAGRLFFMSFTADTSQQCKASNNCLIILITNYDYCKLLLIALLVNLQWQYLCLKNNTSKVVEFLKRYFTSYFQLTFNFKSNQHLFVSNICELSYTSLCWVMWSLVLNI